MVVARHKQILQILFRDGGRSRAQLCAATGMRKMTVYTDADALVAAGILREGQPRRVGRGRPETPLEIDPSRRDVVGLTIRRGRVEAGRFNLLGEPLAVPVVRSLSRPDNLLSTARTLLRQMIGERTLVVGLAAQGLVDAAQRTIVLSAALSSQQAASLADVYAAAAPCPIAVANDIHAVAARWLLTTDHDTSDDALLVYLGDGQLGATLLIDGKPNRGCLIGANELGHTRLAVEADKCYCGRTGCLERICSSQFLARVGGHPSMAEAVAAFDGTDPAVRRMIELLAIGLGNAINFTRVGRMVLVSEFDEFPAFAEALTTAIREEMLRQLAKRVKLEFWRPEAPRSAQTAAWVALASLYYEGWQ